MVSSCTNFKSAPFMNGCPNYQFKVGAAPFINGADLKLGHNNYIFCTIRNSPAYFETKKKDVMAMVCQLGIPTIFFSLSAADTRWSNLLISLGKLLDNITYTQCDIDKMTWEQKCRLIALHPAACVRYFHNGVKKFFKYVLNSPHSLFDHLDDFFYQIEFQHRESPQCAWHSMDQRCSKV